MSEIKQLEKWDGINLEDAFKRAALEMFLPTFHSKWIYTLPEFLSVVGAMRRTENPPPMRTEFERALSIMDEDETLRGPAAKAWEEYKSYWIGDGQADRNEFWISCPRERSAGKIHYDHEEKLPSRTFIEHNFPIRHQREGSCVAQSIGTMIEFIWGKRFDERITLSLYDEARARDGLESPDGGTQLRTAIALAQQEIAEGKRLWNAGLLALNDGDVFSLKKTLAGSKYRKPSPIVAAFAVFASSLYSKASQKSGKWTIPLNAEAPVGYHAITIFGYRDDPSAIHVGGGYFIARNSWGEEYACDSPIGKPGYTLIPYAYAAEYCRDAFAADIPQDATGPEWTPQDDFERLFVHPVEAPSYEQYEDSNGVARGKRLAPDASNAPVRAIERPDDRGFLKEYTYNNRLEFEKRGYAWRKEARPLRYFPRYVDPNLRNAALERLEAQNKFMEGVAANIEDLQGRDSSLRPKCWFSRPRFDVEAPEDVSRGVRVAMAEINGLKDVEELFAPPEYANIVDATAAVKIWLVGDGKRTTAVVAAFIAPLEFRAEENPVFVKPTTKLIVKVCDKIDEAIQGLKGQKKKIDRVCLAFGAIDRTPGTARMIRETVAQRRGLDFTSCSFLDELKRLFSQNQIYWDTKYGKESGEWVAPFRKALCPTTLAALQEMIRPIANDVAYDGDLSVEYFSRKLDHCVSDDFIKEAMDALVYNGEYVWDAQAANGQGAMLRLD